MCYFLCVNNFSSMQELIIITLEIVVYNKYIDFKPLLFSIKCSLAMIPRLTILFQVLLSQCAKSQVGTGIQEVHIISIKGG